MSSEESDPEDSQTLTKHTLSWRAEKVTTFFGELDKSRDEGRSSQAKRQRKLRVLTGTESSREVPTVNEHGKKIPAWAIVSDCRV